MNNPLVDRGGPAEENRPLRNARLRKKLWRNRQRILFEGIEDDAHEMPLVICQQKKEDQHRGLKDAILREGG